MSAFPPLSGDGRTCGEQAKMTAHDPGCVKTPCEENEENDFPRTDKNRPRSTTCVSLIATRRNIYSIESSERRVFTQVRRETGNE